MRSNKYKEQIILEELETFKRKGTIATEAVNEYLFSVENKVRRLITCNIQSNFKELQELLQDSCKTLDQVTIGLATLVPSSNGNCSRPIEDVSRPMIASDATPLAQWSSSDCSVKIDNERVTNSSSPDIVESNAEAMVEPSSSSASSTKSMSRPPFKARMLDILKQQPQRSPLDDEFAMEIPEPPTTLNVDAPEFKPCDFSILSPKSTFSQTSPENVAGKSTQTRDEPPAHSRDPSDDVENLGLDLSRKPPGTSNSNFETDANAPKVMTSSSSMESFLTASATDSEQYKEEEKSTRTEIKKVSGFEIAAGSSNGVDVRDNIGKLAPNCYPNGAESRPSSICTKNVIYDTEQVLRGTAQALREQALDGATGEPESRPSRTRIQDDIHYPDNNLGDTVQAHRERADSIEDEQVDDALTKWIPRQTPSDIPRDVRRTRIPPLWTYVHVNFSEVDVDTGKVYVQMLSDETFIVELSDEMNGSHTVVKPLKMADIAVDLIVIAPYHEQRYRAKVVSKKSENEIEVFFIDYGNKATVRLQDLFMVNNKKLTRICKMAIPCVLDDALTVPNLLEDLPVTAYVCLANPTEVDRETLYRIMDIMQSESENFRELPQSMPFIADDDPGVFPYSVVVTHATSPKSMWLVEAKDIGVAEKIERMLEELPAEPCSPKPGTKAYYVAYGGKRAMVLDCKEGYLDLLLLDDGRSVKNVPLTKCRRLPLMAHEIPGAAKLVSLANCRVPDDAPRLEESMKALVINKTFDMKVKNDDSDDVILVDPVTRKYLAKELNAKYDC